MKLWLNQFPCGQNLIWTEESETTPEVLVMVEHITQHAWEINQ